MMVPLPDDEHKEEGLDSRASGGLSSLAGQWAGSVERWGCGPHQVLKEARKGPSPPVSRESTAPAERSVWASDADWIHACCVSRQVWGNLSQQPQGSNAGAFFQSMNYEVSGETDLEREGEEESLPASSHL